MKNCSQDTGEVQQRQQMGSYYWIPPGFNSKMTKKEALEKGERLMGADGFRRFCEEWLEIQKNMKRE